MLAIRANQLMGSEVVECLLLDYTDIHIVEKDTEAPEYEGEQEGAADTAAAEESF